ncbi:hypothetical protein F2981_20290 (plasmid) [Sinorhizobium meliloti]|nr:hypothetical protein [Sinorhizobium meliloti]
MQKIVEARREFSDGLPADLVGIIEHYQPDRYMASATILDKRAVRPHRAQAHGRVRADTRNRARPVRVAWALQQGARVRAGFRRRRRRQRLTSGQRQKLNLARALIRVSDFYVFNQPLLSLDQRTQDQITRKAFAFLRDGERKPAILWVLANQDLAELFDRVAHFERRLRMTNRWKSTQETATTRNCILM